MEKQEKSCGTIVVKTAGNDKKILIIRNKNGGHWSFPKGHVEKGESEYQTALRETKEETGLDVEIRRHVEPVSVKYSPKKGVWKEVLYFVADYKGGDVSVQQEEVSDLILYNEKVAPYFILEAETSGGNNLENTYSSDLFLINYENWKKN